jgi:hypothetical protein
MRFNVFTWELSGWHTMTQYLETEATPEMIEAGIAVLRGYVFEDGSILRSDYPELVEAIWRAIDYALTSPSATLHPRSEDECLKSTSPMILMERVSSDLGREYVVWPPHRRR